MAFTPNQTKVIMRINDDSAATKSSSFWVATPVDQGEEDAIDDLMNLTVALSIGTEVKRSIIQEEVLANPNDVSAPPEAQSTVNWRVLANNTVTNKTTSFTIGSADVSLLVPDTKLMDLTLPAPAAFVADWEAKAVSEIGQNPLEIISIKLVG